MTERYIVRDKDGRFFADDPYSDARRWLDRGRFQLANAAILTSDEANEVLLKFPNTERVKVL